MHPIYHTQSLILSSRPDGEANKVIVVLSRELGLIVARAQGIRRKESKLRYALQDFSLAKIDFVKGKEFWRITSGSPVTSFPFLRGSKRGIRMIANISKLLQRLMQGEGSHIEIFDDILSTFTFLDEGDHSDEKINLMELYLVLRILSSLGYVDSDGDMKEFVFGGFDPSIATNLSQNQKNIIETINKALRESHL
jgi:DNA repair protein RecO